MIREKANEKVVAPICGEIKLPKEYMKTQNVTNETNLVNKSEVPAPGVIVVKNVRTDLSVHYGLTGETRDSITPG